jgi:hypothetical protein
MNRLLLLLVLKSNGLPLVAKQQRCETASWKTVVWLGEI